MLPLVFEEEWESYMKEAIMKDDQLYMRVLRYEASLPSSSLPVDSARCCYHRPLILASDSPFISMNLCHWPSPSRRAVDQPQALRS